jgi:hypothetical protein
MDVSENQECKKIWRINWLISLADIELQQRWLDKRISNPAWTYAEFICNYFDDLGWSADGYEEKIRTGFVTKEEYDCVRDFHHALDSYIAPNGSYDPLAILNDPTWQKIVAIGHQSVTNLEDLITRPDEKSLFLEQPALSPGDFTWPK